LLVSAVCPPAAVPLARSADVFPAEAAPLGWSAEIDPPAVAALFVSVEPAELALGSPELLVPNPDEDEEEDPPAGSELVALPESPDVPDVPVAPPVVPDPADPDVLDEFDEAPSDPVLLLPELLGSLLELACEAVSPADEDDCDWASCCCLL
jgi:hypothetical protein